MKKAAHCLIQIFSIRNSSFISNIRQHKKQFNSTNFLFSQKILTNLINNKRTLLNSTTTTKTTTNKTSMMSSSNKQNEKIENHIVWVDLEMSGLDLSKDHILEMACLITDQDLNIIAEAPNLIIKQSDEILNGMDDWCTKTHTESGLVNSVKNSEITITKAEEIMTNFIQKYVPKGICPLAGNSIYVDRTFLAKYMSNFNSHLSYRIIDVSSIKELCKRWYANEFKKKPYKKSCHRALDDIKESIEELKYYKASIFKSVD